jgi:hypothetical protein
MILRDEEHEVDEGEWEEEIHKRECGLIISLGDKVGISEYGSAAWST